MLYLSAVETARQSWNFAAQEWTPRPHDFADWAPYVPQDDAAQAAYRQWLARGYKPRAAAYMTLRAIDTNGKS